MTPLDRFYLHNYSQNCQLSFGLRLKEFPIDYLLPYPDWDDKDQNQGVLEVSQDLTKIRQIHGEKRLL
jgi:hypothetical protein